MKRATKTRSHLHPCVRCGATWTHAGAGEVTHTCASCGRVQTWECGPRLRVVPQLAAGSESYDTPQVSGADASGGGRAGDLIRETLKLGDGLGEITRELLRPIGELVDVFGKLDTLVKVAAIGAVVFYLRPQRVHVVNQSRAPRARARRRR